MKSLVHLSSSIVQLPRSTPTQLCLNPDDGLVYAASLHPDTTTVSVWAINLNHYTNDPKLVAVLPAETNLGPENRTERPPILIIGLKALPESNQLCLIMSDGRISVCPMGEDEADEDPLSLKFDNIGAFDDGIRAASWSPDDELLVIITGSDKLVLLTKTFDVLSETPIEYGRFGDDQPVALGWGAKSTQFHGSLGKSAAQTSESPQTQDAKVTPELLSAAFDISWRGDGAFFAITCPGRKDQVTSPRSIKVYSRTGSLSSSSENIPNCHLGDKIAWRPEGSIIASGVRDIKRDQLNIVFFERNGLQRYGFDLHAADIIEGIWGMSWNSDSSVLAVGVRKGSSCGDAESVPSHTYAVQLWTRSNYHWYLKHEAQPNLHTPSPAASASESTPSLMWHPEEPLCLYFSTPGGCIEMRKFTWEPLVDAKLKPDDTGAVAVFDGDKLLLTPFRYQVVPPPMSTFQFSTLAPLLPTPANRRIPTHAAFSPNSNFFAVLFPHGQVICYTWNLPYTNPSQTPLPKPIEICRFCLVHDAPGSVIYRQICIIDLVDNQKCIGSSESVVISLFSEIHCGGQVRDGVHIQKFCYNSDQKNPSKFEASTNSPVLLRAQVGEQWWKLSPCQNGLGLIQTNKGHMRQVLHELTDSGSTCTLHEAPMGFPEYCPVFLSMSSSSSTSAHSSPRVVGLTGSGKLYIGRHLVANDCSSFTADSDHLIYATFSHQLRFVELDRVFGEESAVLDTSETFSIPSSQTKGPSPGMSRAVERGSVIIASVPSSMKVILQMPRGNLETIYPRPMILRSICLDLLKNGNWSGAFFHCRKHKIDFNILVDFDQRRFLLGGVQEFVEQVDNNEHFCLFLSSLRVVDVTEELYPLSKRWKGQMNAGDSSIMTGINKVNTVCELMVLELTKRQVDWKYINSILTAMVCKKPPDYQSALRLLTSVKAEDGDKLDAAVKYIIFLSDVNQLYKFALAMYDLALVILIAQHSQMDPKEYLPFLQSLRDLDPNMRKFKIDDYLGNYPSALRHLSAAGADQFEAVLTYADLHKLYTEAIDIFSGDLVKTKALRKLQGDWLMETNKPVEAGLVWMLAGEIDKAVEGYRQAEAWQEMFALICQSPEDFDILHNAEDMANRLNGSGRYIEAGTILLDYGANLDGAITAFCDGQAFSQAIRIALSRCRPELVPDVILPAAVEFSHSILEELDQLQEQLSKQVERLAELKRARDTNPDGFFLKNKEGENSEALDGVDAMTEATTVFRTDYSRYTQGIQQSARSAATSRSGRSSAQTSKMRKKEAKKKAAGKKGSIYEEEYLLGTLAKVCTEKLPTLQNTLGSLLPALVQLMSLNVASASELLEIARNLQGKLENLQSELIAGTKEVWDQREPKHEAQEVIGGEEVMDQTRFQHINIAVARPIVNNVLTWKLSIL